MPVQMDRISPKGVNNTLYASNFSGADIGAKVNAAIAQLGAAPAGGEIIIPAGSYTFSTPIVATGRNGLWIHGQGRGGQYATAQNNGTYLTFIGTGDAIKLDGTSVGTYYTKISDLTLDLTGSTNGVGVEVIAAYYATLRDLSIVNAKYGVKVNGGGPNGANVIRIDHVDVLLASTAAFWFTGPASTGQQAYNVFMTGGQANCASTTSTDGILIDQYCQNNQFYGVLINGCARGIHDNGGSNVFRDISIQACTTAFKFESTSSSDLIDNPYLFSNGTNFSDSGKDTMYMNIAPAYGPNKMAQPHWVFPYAGGGWEPGIVSDTDGVGGPPRITLYGNTGSNSWPPYSIGVDGSGTLYLQRADITTTIGTLNNKAKTFQIAASGAVTVANNSNVTTATLDASGNLATLGSLKATNETLTAAAPTVAASQIGLGSTTATTVGAAGGASALPATPVGYLVINVAGTAMKIPYYNN